MKDASPQTIYLSDYTPFGWQVADVHLTVKLAPNATRVVSRIHFQPNPNAPAQDFFLHGEELKLIRAAIDGTRGIHDVLGRGRGKDVAHRRRIRQTAPDIAGKGGLVPGAAADHDADLAVARAVPGDDGAPGGALDPEHVRMRQQHPLDGLGDDVLGRVDQLLGADVVGHVVLPPHFTNVFAAAVVCSIHGCSLAMASSSVPPSIISQCSRMTLMSSGQ